MQNSHANPYRTIATGSVDATQYKHGVTHAAVQLAPVNAERRTVRLSNGGATAVWLGASSNVQAGASGINFVALGSGSNAEIEHYAGPIWGIVGGASVLPVWVGVADIG